ncbi:hypothetical protein SASPL_116145 [Salvia splendens]|uniref:Uncharacterized protein n=1 Tax=Salvia splendens TaxID=180675 RepID=A0A8X9A3Q0_SALSN|nr:hypothetical protein SASPL_116145 [Salvia splendens]
MTSSQMFLSMTEEFDMGDVLISGKQSSGITEVTFLVFDALHLFPISDVALNHGLVCLRLQPDNIYGQLGVCATHGARLVLVFIDS